jgi:tetratricopeptide (TPR) repeat protein
VNLVPEREAALKPILDSLIVLMQGEDALMKQRSGLIALEDKKYPHAIALITEAITLLPSESVTEHAFFLCDRAQVYFEMKEYATSILDCQAALELRPELAIAYLRLGSAQFELGTVNHDDSFLLSFSFLLICVSFVFVF